MRATFCGLMLIAATALAEDPPSVTVILPVVGSTVGPGGTHWKTDVELRNDLRVEATVALSLPCAPDQPIILLTIPPGGIQGFTDIAGQAFNVDNVLSPLVIQTLGRRSVRVNASAYAVQGATVTKPQPVPVMDSRSYFPLRTLTGVAYSDTRRTNIGLVNLGETAATFTVALRTQGGDTAGAMRAVIPPNAMWHMAVQLLFPDMAKGDNYSVLIETGARDTYVYGSVVDNTDNAGTFLTPAVGSH